MPSVLPTMTARPKPTPSMRRRPRGVARRWRKVRARFPAAGSRLESDQHHVDRLADVTRRMARPARLELHVAGLPPIHHRLAVRGVLDLAAGQVDDDRVGAVRVNPFRAPTSMRARRTETRSFSKSASKLMPVNGASPGLDPHRVGRQRGTRRGWMMTVSPRSSPGRGGLATSSIHTAVPILRPVHPRSTRRRRDPVRRRSAIRGSIRADAYVVEHDRRSIAAATHCSRRRLREGRKNQG